MCVTKGDAYYISSSVPEMFTQAKKRILTWVRRQGKEYKIRGRVDFTTGIIMCLLRGITSCVGNHEPNSREGERKNSSRQNRQWNKSVRKMLAMTP